jgi:anti-sigma B factor antagonist
MEELETSDTNFGIAQSHDDSGDLVVTLSGELDISSAETFREVMEKVIATDPGTLVFELGELTFMDSSGIAVMVHAANSVTAVELRHASSIIRRVVEATGLSEVLRLSPS